MPPDPTPPPPEALSEEQIEAAAAQWYDATHRSSTWDEASPQAREMYVEDVIAVLTAINFEAYEAVAKAAQTKQDAQDALLAHGNVEPGDATAHAEWVDEYERLHSDTIHRSHALAAALAKIKEGTPDTESDDGWRTKAGEDV